MKSYLYDILNDILLIQKIFIFFKLKYVIGSLFFQSLGRRKLYYYPRVILLDKRKQILVRKRCIASKKRWGFYNVGV